MTAKKPDGPEFDQSYEVVPIDTVRPHPDNARRGDLKSIKASIRQLGFRGALIVQRSTGTIVVGNHRWRAAKELGIERVPVVFADIDDRKALMLLAADNRSHDLGDYDEAQLDMMLETLRAPTDDEADDFAALLADLEWSPADTDDTTKPEREPEEPEPIVPSDQPVTRTGDLWQLDDHRIVCGDAFDEDARKLLLDGFEVAVVVTDPPFAIYGSSSGISSSVADDKMVQPFFEQLGRTIRDSVPWFAHVYVCCDWRSYATLWHGFKRAELTPKNCLVWDKGAFGLGSNWPNAHEFVAFFTKMPPELTMSANQKTGQRTVTAHPNILRYPRVRGEEREHNAAKPIALLAEIIEVASDPGGGVLDLFGGSGSTLIAAGNVGRRAAVMEMEPKWVDVTVRRWERITGGTGRLNGEERRLSGAPDPAPDQPA